MEKWNPYSVVKTILLSEKSMEAKEQKKYYFELVPKANKILVAKAVEDIYNVKVASVNILIRKGKFKRIGRGRYKPGQRSDVKKAIVTLKEGSIEII